MADLQTVQCTIRIQERADHQGYILICSEKLSTLSRYELVRLREMIDTMLAKGEMSE